jgi:hypothetical protein
LIQALNIVNVGAFGIQIREFPNERRVPIVASFLEGGGLDLTNHADFMTCYHKSLRVNREPMNGNTGGRKSIEMGFRGVYSVSISQFLGMDYHTYVRQIETCPVYRQCQALLQLFAHLHRRT